MRIKFVPQQNDQRSTELTPREPDHAQSTAQKPGVPSKSYQISEIHEIFAKIRVIWIWLSQINQKSTKIQSKQSNRVHSIPLLVAFAERGCATQIRNSHHFGPHYTGGIGLRVFAFLSSPRHSFWFNFQILDIEMGPCVNFHAILMSSFSDQNFAYSNTVKQKNQKIQ